MTRTVNEPFFEPHQVPLARPWFDDSEMEAAREVVRSGYLCQGPKTAEFERAFAARLEVQHAVAVSSGSTALLVALQAMGVGPRDEVIVPDMTFISTATAAMYLGARPALCDITLRDYNIDPARIESLVTQRTKAIVPVHYAGQSAEMDAVCGVARAHGLMVLEDAAEAHLARYRGGAYAGTLGDAAIFSFTPTKPMTTGEGGMIVTDSDELAARCRLIRNFGDSGKFDWHLLGFNFRGNEVAAAIGICQLRKLDHIVEVRREKARRYDEAFSQEDALITPWARSPEDTNYQLYTLRLELDRLDCDRDTVIAELSRAGVAARLYYPALHRMRVFEPFGGLDDRGFPNACAFAASALSIPIYTGLTAEEQDYVIHTVLKTVRRHKK